MRLQTSIFKKTFAWPFRENAQSKSERVSNSKEYPTPNATPKNVYRAPSQKRLMKERVSNSKEDPILQFILNTTENGD